MQEALTNVLTNAGLYARVKVRIARFHRDTDALVIEVSDRGGSAARLPGAGLGTAGMHDRLIDDAALGARFAK